ncbi:MAG: hypothetical protein LBT70_04000 [Holosporaceae bacterium]|jgi:hypothetical protein|nr:hypothetical protein [Holosporaceae bacterium]
MFGKICKSCLLLLLFCDSIGVSDATLPVQQATLSHRLRLCFSGDTTFYKIPDKLVSYKGEIPISLGFVENLQQYLKFGARFNFCERENDAVVDMFIEVFPYPRRIFSKPLCNKHIIFSALELQNLKDALVNNCDLLVDIERFYASNNKVLYDVLKGISLKKQDCKFVLKSVSYTPLVKTIDAFTLFFPEEKNRLTDEMINVFVVHFFSLHRGVNCIYENSSLDKPGILTVGIDEPPDPKLYSLDEYYAYFKKTWWESIGFGRSELIVQMILLDRVFAAMPQQPLAYPFAWAIADACAFVTAKIMFDYHMNSEFFLGLFKYPKSILLGNEIYILKMLDFTTYISEEEYREYNTMLGYDGDIPLKHIVFQSREIRKNQKKLLAPQDITAAPEVAAEVAAEVAPEVAAEVAAEVVPEVAAEVAAEVVPEVAAEVVQRSRCNI